MKRILTMLSEWGYWGEELVGPYDVLLEHGYQVDFMTATGRKPPALPPSMDETYVDPPLDKHVTDSHYARRTREVHESKLLDKPINLSKWFPPVPYFNGPNFGHALEAYYNQRDACWKDLEKYDALLLPGGSGPMVDMVNNERLHDVILGFLAQDKLIAAECYCVTCLAFARDWTERKSIIRGKHVTGHAREYDYKDGTGFAQMYDYDGQADEHQRQFWPAVLSPGVHPAGCGRPGWSVPRRRWPYPLHDPGLSLPDRTFDAGFPFGRRADDRGAGARAAKVRMAIGWQIGRLVDWSYRQTGRPIH